MLSLLQFQQYLNKIYFIDKIKLGSILIRIYIYRFILRQSVIVYIYIERLKIFSIHLHHQYIFCKINAKLNGIYGITRENIYIYLNLYIKRNIERLMGIIIIMLMIANYTKQNTNT